MKYGLLVTSPIGPYKNIGDYFQSLAALQFTSSPFCYIEKEKLSEFQNDEKVKVIMNAWYMWHPEYWPPQDENIDPLLISMHITPLRAQEMLKGKGKEYLIKHGPVGCRDINTLEILNKNGISAYFSGCLTLTLGYQYKYTGEKKGVFFVDPYISPLRYSDEKGSIYFPLNALRAFYWVILNFSKVRKLRKKKYFSERPWLLSVYNATMFYHAYSKLFDDDTIFNAEYISHMVKINDNYKQKDLLATAENMLHKYMSANYVVTSRIHCALPCIGVNTSVIFVLDEMMNSDRNLFGSPGRFGGLIDFFRVANYTNYEVKTKDPELNKIGKLNMNSKFQNKDNWKSYKDKMIETCLSFMRSSNF